MYNVLISNGDVTQYMHRPETIQTTKKLSSAVIQDEINAISSFSFTIYPNNPCYSRMFPFSSMVKVFNTQKQRYDFKGRILKISPQLDSDGVFYKTVVCESRLAYLRDSIQPYAEEKQYEGDDERNGLQEFIDFILENHNSQVTDEKKIYRGDVTVNPFKTSDGVYKGLNYENTWDVIKNKLIGSYGGEVDLREGSDGKLYLDYKEEIGTTRSTTLEIAKNIESASREIDTTTVITRLIPLGAKQKSTVTDGNGNTVEKETGERLTVESVNSGLKYIEDTAATALYGVIYGTVVYDDVTQASNLKRKAQQYLTENNKINISDNVTALDLSLIGLDIDDFKVFDKYPYKNSVLGIDDVVKIIKKTTNIIEPYASSFTLGNTTKLLSDALFDYDAEIKSIRNNTSTIITEVKNSGAGLQSYIKKTEDDIKSEIRVEIADATSNSKFTSTVKNILKIDENDNATSYNVISSAITDAGSDTYWQWKKYSDGTMDIFGGYYLTEISCKIAFGSWYRSAIINLPEFPCSFSAAPDVVMSFAGGGAVIYETNNGSTNKTPSFYLICPNSVEALSGRVSVIARGKWKT